MKEAASIQLKRILEKGKTSQEPTIEELNLILNLIDERVKELG